MVFGNIVVTEERLPGDYVQIKRMQETHVLGQVGDGIIPDLARQRMLKRNVDGAIAILNVKDHGVAASLLPALDQLNAAGAAGRSAGQVDSANLAFLGKGPRLLHDRLWLDAGNK